MPVAVILVAYYLAEVRRASKGLFIILVSLLGVCIFFTLPTRITSDLAENMTVLEDFYFRLKYPILIVHAVGFALNIVIIYKLKYKIVSNTRANFQYFLERIGFAR